MSDAEQKGKWLEEFQTARRKLVKINGRLRDVGKIVAPVSNAIQQGKLDAPGNSSYLAEWPSKEEMFQLFTEMREANQTLKEVRELLAQEEIDLK